MIVTDTIAGIALALDKVSDENTIITAEAIEQTDPGKDYVLIRLTSAETTAYLGDYHRMRLHFDVAWLPASPGAGNNTDMYTAAFTMVEALMQIELPGGMLKKAFDTAWTIDEEAAHVQAAYDVFMDKSEAGELVKRLELDISTEE